MSHRQLFASGETIREQKDEIAGLQAEIERLRLTDEEREAVLRFTAKDYHALLVQCLRDKAAEIERLRLTDEERQAVEWCVEMAIVHATECDEEIATLRRLLERTV